MTLEDISLVLVIGCQRSGTTLTGQILGAHPRAALIDEFDGLYPWVQSIADKADDCAQKTAAVFAKSASKYKDPASRFTGQGDGIALAEGVDTLVLKAPNLTYGYSMVARLGMPAVAVYPVRDPRAVVGSMLRLSNINFVENQAARIRNTPQIEVLFPDEVAVINDADAPYWLRAAKVWQIKSGLQAPFTQAGIPVFDFRYEDLVQDPSRYIAEIGAFSGLSGSNALFAHQDIYVGEGPGGTDRTRAVDRTSERSWSDTLDDATAAQVLAAVQPLAGQFGYE